MFKHLLVPIVFPRSAELAADTAANLAHLVGAKVELVCIVAPDVSIKRLPVFSADAQELRIKEYQDKAKLAADQLDQLKQQLSEKYDATIECTVLTGNDPSQLVDTLLKSSFDLLVVNGRKKSRNELFGARIHEKVIQHAKCPILIVNQNIDPFKVSRIVFASQFGKEATRSVKEIFVTQRIFDAECVLLYVNTPLNFKATHTIVGKGEKFIANNQLQNCSIQIYNDRKVETGVRHFVESLQSDLTFVFTENSAWAKHYFSKYAS